MLVTASVSVYFFFYHYSLRGIDFFVSREYMILSTFVVTEPWREWESAKKNVSFQSFYHL